MRDVDMKVLTRCEVHHPKQKLYLLKNNYKYLRDHRLLVHLSVVGTKYVVLHRTDCKAHFRTQLRNVYAQSIIGSLDRRERLNYSKPVRFPCIVLPLRSYGETKKWTLSEFDTDMESRKKYPLITKTKLNIFSNTPTINMHKLSIHKDNLKEGEVYEKLDVQLLVSGFYVERRLVRYTERSYRALYYDVISPSDFDNYNRVCIHHYGSSQTPKKFTDLTEEVTDEDYSNISGFRYLL